MRLFWGGGGRKVSFTEKIDCRATKRGRTLDFQSNNWTEPHQLEKNHYIWCAQSNEVSVALCQVFRVLLPNTTDHDSDRMQDLSWQLSCCLRQRIRNISIFTWISAMLGADVSEQRPDGYHLMNITYFPQHLMEYPGSMNTFANILFNDYYQGWQLARKVVHPQLRSINLTLHLLSPRSRPPLLIKQRCLSGRISSAWWSPTVRPEHWERERERESGSGVPDCQACEVLFLK